MEWKHDFKGRVNFVARAMLAGSEPTRRFFGCFEMEDGDAVCAALVRRARKSPRLASVLYRYLTRARVDETAAKLEGRNLEKEAARMRADSEAAWNARHTSAAQSGA